MININRIIIVIILLFVFLFYIRKVNNLKENFVNNIRKKTKENFTNDIPSVNDIEPQRNIETTIEENKSVENNPAVDTSAEKYDMSSNKEEKCLFGCEEQSEDMSVDDMMKTIEETEKLCDMIDEKDRIRREKEEIENVEKQIELNKKFLLQQKSQNKQIEDLQNIVKSMVFTDEMNKVAINKCSGKTDECLSNKEEKLSKIFEEKQKKNKKLTVNLNLDQFDNNLKEALIQQLGATDAEAQRLLDLINSGAVTLDDLKSSVNTFYNGSQSGMNNSGINSSGTIDNNNGCPNCKIDLSKYIDRCKIPCLKCRDPAWGCPKDK